MDLLSKPKILCKKHPSYKCQSFSHDAKADSLICINCICSGGFRSESIVLLDKVKSGSKRGVIENWPPLGKEGNMLSQRMMQICEGTSNELDTQIEDFISNLESEVFRTVANLKKKLIMESEKYFAEKMNLIQMYKDMSDIAILQKAVEEAESNNYNQLKELIKHKNEQSDASQILLKKGIDSLDKVLVQFDFENIHKQMQDIMIQLEQISFKKTEKKERKAPSPQLILSEEQKEMFGTIFSLIQDMTSSMLQDEEEKFYQFLIQKRASVEEEKEEALNQHQFILQNLQCLANLHELINESMFEQQVQQVQQEVIPKTLKIKLNKIYQDFSNPQTMLMSILPGLLIDDDVLVSSESDADQYLKKIIGPGHSYASIDTAIDNSKKYILRCTLQNFSNSCFSGIGLIPTRMVEDNWREKEGMIYFANNCFESETVDEVLKGKNIWKERIEKCQVEVRICVVEGTFMILDYPNYENVLGPSEKAHLPVEEEYRISFYLFGKDDMIQVNELKIVDKFSNII